MRKGLPLMNRLTYSPPSPIFAGDEWNQLKSPLNSCYWFGLIMNVDRAVLLSHWVMYLIMQYADCRTSASMANFQIWQEIKYAAFPFG